MNSPLTKHVTSGRVVGKEEPMDTNPSFKIQIDTGLRIQPYICPVDVTFPAELGDWVHLVVQGQNIIHFQLLQKREGHSPFPDPKGDWYRLQKNQRNRVLNLYKRGKLLGIIRDYFAKREFLEIEAPLLVPSPGLELHLQALKIEGSSQYLITSPEYQLKRLLVGGFQKIYSLGKVFRGHEEGPHHNPEFTMLEWYRAHEGWQSVCTDVEDLYETLAVAINQSTVVSYQGKLIDFAAPWPRMTVQEAVERYAGVCLRGNESTEDLIRLATQKGWAVPSAPHHWDDVFFSLFMDQVEPHLGKPAPGQTVFTPVILYDWPKQLCALARQNPSNPFVVERFEAYAGGLELCNGFGELCDPHEQRKRFAKDAQARVERGLPVYPTDERFLAALEEGMPPSGGVALGVDRLMMLLLDAAQIVDVLPFSKSEL